MGSEWYVPFVSIDNLLSTTPGVCSLWKLRIQQKIDDEEDLHIGIDIHSKEAHTLFFSLSQQGLDPI